MAHINDYIAESEKYRPKNLGKVQAPPGPSAKFGLELVERLRNPPSHVTPPQAPTGYRNPPPVPN